MTLPSAERARVGIDVRALADRVHSELGFPYTGFLVRYTEFVLEEAAKAAERTGSSPVGAGDGGTYVVGSALDAARAVRALKPQTVEAT